MSKIKNKKRIELPSGYDYYYFDKVIFEYNSDMDAIEKTCKENNYELTSCLRGISYFNELVVIDMINHLEDLIPNSYLDDIIHWSETDIRKNSIKKLKDKEPILQYCFELNDFRKQLAKIRMKIPIMHSQDSDNFRRIIKVILEKLKEIDEHLRNTLKISRLNPDKEEAPLILNWFLVKFNYIKGGWDTMHLNDDSFISAYPGGVPFFYLMSPETRKHYHLQNPRIKDCKKEYLMGYKVILIHFYQKFLSAIFFETIRKDILFATRWHHLHKVYGRIINSKEYCHDHYFPIFKIGKNIDKSRVFKKKVITSADDLDIIFRRMNNLSIKIIRPDGDKARDEHLTHFLHVLTGAKYIQQANIEVLEFRQIFNGCRHDEYAYAIFMPLRGMISDASYWLFFNAIGLSNDEGYKSNGKVHVENLFEILKKTKQYNIQSFKIRGDLLADYIKNKNIAELQLNKITEQNKNAKGLLAEFISYLDVAKEYGAVLVDVERDIKSTDIDIIAESKDSIILIQAKNSFPSKSETEDILRHFERAIISLKFDKNIKKVLFLIDDEPSFNSIDGINTNSSQAGIIEVDINSIQQQVINMLSKENIEVRFYSEFKKKLAGRKYNNLVKKLDNIFNLYDLNDEFL